MCEKFPTTGIGVALDSHSQTLTFWRLLSEVFLTIGANYQHLTPWVCVAYAQRITTPFSKCITAAFVEESFLKK